MNQIKLRQLQNNVEVIGTLKSKELEVKTSLAGKNFISGRLVVLSTIDGKINEQVIEVFTMQSSKLFRGIETVMNEYRTIDQDGIGNADRIKVKGALKLKEYYNNENELIQYNEIRGMIFNRLDKNDIQQSKVVASMETIIEGFEPIIEDEVETGDYSVKGFTVGWNGEVVELKDTFVSSELAKAFMNLYQPGSTGSLSFKLNSHSEEKEEDQKVNNVAFGTTVDVEETFEANKKYANSIEIIGGGMPYEDGTEYSSEEIAAAKQSRNLKLLELKNKNNGSTIPMNNGFGFDNSAQNGINKNTSAFMDGNSIPHF